MAKPTDASTAPLDGHVADEHGKFGWAAPDEEFSSLSTTRSGRSAPTCTGAGGTSGPAPGGHAVTAGLVDEYHLFVWPVVVGGGRALPPRPGPAPARTAG
jgi:hypothetical protein